MKRLTLCLMSLLALPASASIFDWNLWGADSNLKKENYPAAVQDYLKIQAKDPDNSRLNYNLGIGLYRLGSYENAAFNFERSARETKSPILKERALYNLGNAMFQKEEYETAIKAYETALKIDPEDEDAKHNLELAKKKLNEQNQNQQNQDQNKDNQDQQNKDQQKKDQNKDNQDQQKQDQQKKDQNKDNQDQQKQDQNQNQDQKKSEPKEKKGSLDKQEIKMLLMQVKEAKPKGKALGVKSKSPSDPKAKKKPW